VRGHPARPAGGRNKIVQRLGRTLRAAFASAPGRERGGRDGAEPGTMTPEASTQFLQQDLQHMVKIAADLNLPTE
jgi:hypothetical protein